MEQDKIEREIHIDASAERVWSLVRTPGWWINDGEPNQCRIERVGGLDVVHHPKHGTFPIRTEQLDPPRYAAFRWFLDAGALEGGALEGGGPNAQAALDASKSTLTEFWIDAHAGGVTLRVVESGLGSLPGTEEERRRHVDENTQGWEFELDVARRYTEAG